MALTLAGSSSSRIDNSTNTENNLNVRLSRKHAARLRLIGATIVIFAALPAAAKDPGKEAYMIRMLACEGSDAKMEIYLPRSAVFDRDGGTRTINNSIIGYYALDLSEANKGKPLEPVRISLTTKKP